MVCVGEPYEYLIVSFTCANLRDSQLCLFPNAYNIESSSHENTVMCYDHAITWAFELEAGYSNSIISFSAFSTLK